MSEAQPQSKGVSALIGANVALIVTIIFGAGVSYQRLTAVESRLVSIEARIQQLDTISALQAKVSALEEEVRRARDRVDRAVDLRVK